MTPKFQARIEQGRIKLSRGEGALYRDWLTSLEGKDVDVVIEKHKDVRSLSQNSYLWSVVYKLISDHTGFTTEEIHEYCKAKFLGTKRMEIAGEGRFVQKCTHDVPKDMFFEEYIDPIRQWGAEELQLVIPDPNQITA